MATKETYLLGVDLAIDQETGETHSSGHSTLLKLDTSTKDKLSNIMNHRTSLFKVQGNFKDTVYTTSLLKNSIQTLYQNIPIAKAHYQKIYNLNDGAKIQDCIPTHIEDIDLTNYDNINQNELHNDLLELFKKYSKTELSKNDLSSLKQRLLNAKDIKNLILEFENNSSKSNSDKYLYDLLGLVSTILKKGGREYANLIHVYYHFFQFALAIVDDIFNTKGLKNEKRHIKKVDKILVKEMLSICDIYITKIEDFFLSIEK